MKKSILQNCFGEGQAAVRSLRLLLLIVIGLASSITAYAQTTVKGKVTDDTGMGLPGVSVMVKGTTNGTQTDANGNYALSVPGKNAVLVFSFIGYTAVEKPLNGQATVNVNMAADSKSLSEVVVIGYGTQRREAVTGSVASISGDKLTEVPTANVTQALQGRLAGVDISQTSSKPGATTQIRIRGTRSLTADNNPLIVLDGIPFTGSISDINPNDIKSLDVLKDASATAIYGARGANGVILITTNRGQKNQKARVSYNAYAGSQEIFAKVPMMNGPQLAALRKEAKVYTSNGVDEDDAVNTDWQDLFFKTGAVTSHDIGVSGGTETGNYNFGLGYYKNQAVVPSQQYSRYSFKASMDQNLGKIFRVGFTSNNNYNLNEGGQIGTFGAYAFSPLINPYKSDGSLKRVVNMASGDSYVLTSGVVDSLTNNGLWLNETRGFATYNSFYGEVSIPWVEGLKFRTNLGLDFVNSNNGNFTGQGVNAVNATTVSNAGISNSQTYHWTIENLLTYDKTIGKHNFNVVALYSAEQNKYNRSSVSVKDIPAEAFQFYNLGQAAGEKTIDPNNQDYQLWGLISGMGRIMYSYDDRYLLSATLRSDASSRLAPGHQWHTYPAVSVGWNISKESFFNVSKIDMLKIRAGFGQTSNQAVQPYATLGRLSTRPYNFGDDVYETGYYVSSLPNPKLGWEYSKTTNLGVDFSLFNNRLSGTAEYYVTNTKDILLAVGLPETSGVASITQNVGETQNKGVEISLNGTILDNPDGLTWQAGVNFYTNKNKLVALASGQLRDEGNAWFVGHNINAIYDYEKIGLWQQNDPYRSILEPGTDDDVIGSIKVKYTGEYNADGTPKRAIGEADRQIIDVDPDFQGGFNTRFAYKGFDLSAVAIYRHGGVLISSLYGSSGYLNTLTSRNNNVQVDYWTPDNTNAEYPRPGRHLSGDNPKYGSTLGYFDGSYLKVRTITLGYDFNRSLIKNNKINLKAYFTVQNPFVLFSPYHDQSGMDPETNSYGNENAAVPLSQNLRRILTIGTNTPSTRNYILGLNLTF
ncbi:SusC/RagA family protein [Pelobium manganitolerans]|uniref:SusC/RagA family protein n=1 Tax=Pelobium manganitolerans TaxID=1842495 RepID=A0A419S887_9SPHI|nr:TonB-dependent receptor [Pelobium manganitolerans]RKD17988.1 SusC/RagA family protein [Pelobium manganitolerans]